MDVIIFSGQSNMQGQSERLSENAPVPGAYEYKWFTDSLVPLKNPVGENITYEKKEGYELTLQTDIVKWVGDHAMGSSCYGHTNLVPSFCRTYTARTHREVVAVHAAKGSTDIASWLPGTILYNILVSKANAAVRKTAPERILFVWLQGESDAHGGNTRTYYKEKLHILCDALKKDVGIELFGIIRMGRFTNDDRDLEIIAAQDEICRESKDFAMLTDIASGLCGQPAEMNPTLHGHYSAEGLERLGREAASYFG